MKPSVTEIDIAASRASVFRVLADPETYPRWLVGAATTRAVDDRWPAVGARFSHRIGVLFLRLPGSTTVVAIDPPKTLELAAGMGLLGEARVRFDLSTTTAGTRVRVSETGRRGPVRWASLIAESAVNAALWGRNDLSLSNLRDVVEAE